MLDKLLRKWRSHKGLGAGWRLLLAGRACILGARSKLRIHTGSMEKFFIFMSEQWLLVTAIAAALWSLVWLENRRAGTGLSPHALTALVNSEGALIVDLREKPDFDNGHIVDAINLPYSKWQSQQSSGSTELDDKQEHHQLIGAIVRQVIE